MGIADALIGLKRAREQWAIEGPVREASIAKMEADTDIKRREFDTFEKASKRFDDYMKNWGESRIEAQSKQKLQEGKEAQYQQTQQQSTSTPMGDSFGGQGQGMNPKKAMLLDALAKAAGQEGYDFSGMVRNQTARSSLDLRRTGEERLTRQGDERIAQTIKGREQRKFIADRKYEQTEREYNLVETIDEDGSKRKVVAPKRMSKKPGGLALGDAILTSPGTGNLPVEISKVPFFINRETLEPATERKSPNQYNKDGYMPVPATMMPSLTKLRTALMILGEIETQMEKLIPKKEWTGKIGGITRSFSAWAQMTNKGKELAVLRDFIDANKALFAKSLGEVGNLNEMEQESVKTGLGAIGDSGEKAWAQYKLAKTTFDTIRSTVVPPLGKKPDLKGLSKKPTKDLTTMSDADLLKQLGN